MKTTATITNQPGGEPVSNLRLVCSSCGIYKLTPEEFARLHPGMLVKLHDNEERFWAKIISINKDNLNVQIDNDLVNKHAYQYGDIIQIHKDDIIDVFKEKPP